MSSTTCKRPVSRGAFSQRWRRCVSRVLAESFPTARNRTNLAFGEILVFVLLPIGYAAAPVGVMLRLGSVGDLWASVASLFALVLGWALHLSERWALDLLCYPSSWMQPTAAFHVLSAAAIWAACCHVESSNSRRPIGARGSR